MGFRISRAKSDDHWHGINTDDTFRLRRRRRGNCRRSARTGCSNRAACRAAPALQRPQPPPAPTTGTRAVTLNWAAPTQYENGSPFVDLAGYRIFYGSAPGKYTKLVEIAPGTTSHNILALPATTHYFSISAYNHEGVESTLSNEVAISLN